MMEDFMMIIFQGITDDLPPFGKYCTHMFQNNYMPVVGECQSKVLPFTRLHNYLFSPEDDTNKSTLAMIGQVEVTASKALFSEIRDKKGYGEASIKCWGHIMLG